MLKSILNLDGVKSLDKTKQKNIFGGSLWLEGSGFLCECLLGTFVVPDCGSCALVCNTVKECKPNTDLMDPNIPR